MKIGLNCVLTIGFMLISILYRDQDTRLDWNGVEF